MKVLVAAASFAANISGIQRHALNLVRCLLTRPEIRSVFFVVAPWQEALMHTEAFAPDPRLTTHVVNMKRHSSARNVWYYRQLPRIAKTLQADLVHLTYPVPLNAAGYSCPTVVTLHDLYPCEIPMNFGFPKCVLNRIVLEQCLRNVKSIACVSDATMMSLGRYFPGPMHKAVRIYNCVDPDELAGMEDPLPGWTGLPFLLSVAQHRRNKNIPLLLQTFDRLLRCGKIAPETQLIVIGIRGPETPGLERMVAERGLSSRVRFLEGLPEAQLRWCYRQCQALIAPSITEGFGLPIAEGLLNGCRIVASDIPAHREIGGDRCRLVRLGDRAEEELAGAILASLRTPKPEPIALSPLTAPVLGQEYVGLYRRLIAAAATDPGAVPAMTMAPPERRSL